ncbi:lytic murein transglycosylase B [Paraglaciecola sp. T6c]|uniref:lytic murein transglycosylase B n=1 Tax=Pseudoalteromonas atlantica (strain T6c / ATCC BAA-1087) TaxID=3042615 RepID=UPI00005C6CC1|nr:lytic murein transglycosylase B [Paraglaciecola sp. T6c]ABG40080.1 lytic murein transglycosylase B [Paraglaciecola sp. T6c]
MLSLCGANVSFSTLCNRLFRRVPHVLLALHLIVLAPISSAQSLPEAETAFLDAIVTKHNLNRETVLQLLNQAEKDQAVIDAIKRPWEAKPWHLYYPIFLTEKRLQKGLEFYQAHGETLARAEKEYGVPAEMIVAILGIESFYGTYKGSYAALNALYTLGFHYPPRSSFFKKELAQLILLANEEEFDAKQLQSSYAGAMGWGQFIPSSYRHYAVDFDNDGVRDLLNNPVDAIGSIANYFKRNGWQRGDSIAFPVNVTPENAKPWLRKSLKYRETFAQLQQADISLDVETAKRVGVEKAQDKWDGIAADSDAKLLDFAQASGHDYWLGLKNFYVITRYNHSKLYAMVAFQFSRQLASGINSLDKDAQLSPQDDA